MTPSPMVQGRAESGSLGLGTAVAEVWQAMGLGWMDMLAIGDGLILPVYRPDTKTPKPLVIALDFHFEWRADIDDDGVTAAMQAQHACEQIVMRYGDGDEIEWREEGSEDGSPAVLYTTGLERKLFAKRVYWLAQCAQALLDYADGFTSGQRYPKDQDAIKAQQTRERALRAVPFQLPKQRTS